MEANPMTTPVTARLTVHIRVRVPVWALPTDEEVAQGGPTVSEFIRAAIDAEARRPPNTDTVHRIMGIRRRYQYRQASCVISPDQYEALSGGQSLLLLPTTWLAHCVILYAEAQGRVPVEAEADADIDPQDESSVTSKVDLIPEGSEVEGL